MKAVTFDTGIEEMARQSEAAHEIRFRAMKRGVE